MNLIAKILSPRLILIGIGIVLASFFVWWITSFTVVKKQVIENYIEATKADSINIVALSQELKNKSAELSQKDTLSTFQDNRIKGLQQSVKDTKLLLMRAENEAKRANGAIEHYENNGLIRYFIFDKQGLFKKGCYQEVFEKPKNICK